MFVDESHISIPQVRGMYGGDRSRKTTLVDYGFRLPSARSTTARSPSRSSRPRLDQVDLRLGDAGPVRDRALRPGRSSRSSARPASSTPRSRCAATDGQIDDLLDELRLRVERGAARARDDAHEEDGRGPRRLPARDGRRRSTTCTPRSRRIERIEILRDLRLGVYDVVVGMNLLREGSTCPR